MKCWPPSIETARRWTLRDRPPARFSEFKKWLTAVTASADVEWMGHGKYAEWKGRSPRDPASFSDFATERIASISKPLGLEISSDGAALLDIAWPEEVAHVVLSLGTKPYKPVSISDKKICRLDVSTKHPVALHRCFIGTLDISSGESRVVLDDCYVARLKLKAGVLSDFRVRGGHIIRIGTPPTVAASSNPFVGRTTIKNLYLSRDIREVDPEATADGRSQVIHEYRNVRTFLSAKNDGLSAGVFHAAELAMERDEELSRWSQAFSYIYEVGCDFGNSVARPIKWLLILLAAMAAIVLAFNCVTPGPDLSGWQLALKDSDWCGRALRAFIYPLQAVFNPLGIFSAKPLLIANNTAASIVLTIIGLLGTLCIAFVLIALRRRFRLE